MALAPASSGARALLRQAESDPGLRLILDGQVGDVAAGVYIMPGRPLDDLYLDVVMRDAEGWHSAAGNDAPTWLWLDTTPLDDAREVGVLVRVYLQKGRRGRVPQSRHLHLTSLAKDLILSIELDYEMDESMM